MAHQHTPALQEKSKGHSLGLVFMIGIVINIVYLLAEALAGLFCNSMGLLSDAGHNLSDVVGLVLAFTAYKLLGVQSSRRFTYGYKKATILISLLNAMILSVAVVFIVVESIQKLINPDQLKGGVISIVAAIGVLVNGFTAYLLLKNRRRDLNVRGAFVHMVADAMVSVGVVISGVVIYFTEWSMLDGLIGLAVAVVIIFSTWDLIRATIRLALDGVPMEVDYDQVIASFLSVDGVIDMHHLHIWALSTTQNALTAHVQIRDLSEMENIKAQLKSKLDELGISHATLEFESLDFQCTDRNDDTPED
ncbi:MAG: cation diffusion facilitator family transporter [Bacteroidales bacterium]|nr:cation diffusion facilitator family transporter [Bacteroidales bacterium]